MDYTEKVQFCELLNCHDWYYWSCHPMELDKDFRVIPWYKCTNCGLEKRKNEIENCNN